MELLKWHTIEGAAITAEGVTDAGTTEGGVIDVH